MNVTASRISESLHSSKRVSGLTHNFYKYPASFSPELAHEIISQFSNKGDCIFDPFMGGGTSIVESLSMGRQALGNDINSLGLFVTNVKTTPLSSNDLLVLQNWISEIDNEENSFNNLSSENFEYLNLPKSIIYIFQNILSELGNLVNLRIVRFVKCAMLRVSQRMIESEHDFTESIFIQKLIDELVRMNNGLDEFVNKCRLEGINKNKINGMRTLLNRSAIGIHLDNKIASIANRPCLVFTSPPYPGVHILYHRWQILGRKETSVPYWICGLDDGKNESYYTLGGRKGKTNDYYFDQIVLAYQSIAQVIKREALIVQLVGFSNIENQLSFYLSAMEKAGFEEIFPITHSGERIWRFVPNRKWYTQKADKWDTSKEVLVFHRKRLREV